MPFSRLHLLSPLLASAALCGCNSDKGTSANGFCSAIYTPAVTVVAVDTITGAPLAGTASGTAVAMGVDDTLFHGSTPADSVLHGGSAAGTYTVTISRPGYRTWQLGSITVTPTGVCSELNTVSLRARMAPAP